MKKGRGNIRDILNEIKWNRSIDNVEIWFIHRGAPNNTKIISGNEIKQIGISFLDTSSAIIPYHRIIKIIYNGKVLFER
jgi:uncharacterized protein (UPF0248 family)